MSAGVGGCDTGVSWRNEALRGCCDLLGIGSERKGRPQQVFCCRGGDETWWEGEESREKRRCGSAVSLLIALTGAALEWGPFLTLSD